LSEAENYRRKSDDLLRQAVKADNLSNRSQLINQAVYFNELAQEAERVAAEERQEAATVVRFASDVPEPSTL
jgi:hypothetical protein